MLQQSYIVLIPNEGGNYYMVTWNSKADPIGHDLSFTIVKQVKISPSSILESQGISDRYGKIYSVTVLHGRKPVQHYF